MRTINKEIEYKKYVNVVERVVSENIVNIFEDKRIRSISILVAFKNEVNEIVKEESFEIKGENYDKLMANKPPFAPNKPENEYREEDIWYIIDLIRNGQ